MLSRQISSCSKFAVTAVSGFVTKNSIRYGDIIPGGEMYGGDSVAGKSADRSAHAKEAHFQAVATVHRSLLTSVMNLATREGSIVLDQWPSTLKVEPTMKPSASS